MMNHKRRFGSGNFMHSFGLSYQEAGDSVGDSSRAAWAKITIEHDRTPTCRARYFVKRPRNILITKIGDGNDGFEYVRT